MLLYAPMVTGTDSFTDAELPSEACDVMSCVVADLKLVQIEEDFLYLGSFGAASNRNVLRVMVCAHSACMHL